MSLGQAVDDIIMRDLRMSGMDDVGAAAPGAAGGAVLKIVERHLQPLTKSQLKALLMLYALGEDKLADKYLELRQLQGDTKGLITALEAMRTKNMTGGQDQGKRGIF